MKWARIGAWVAGIVGGLAFGTVSAAMSSLYTQWERELGVNMNQHYEARQIMESKDGRFEALVRRAPQKGYMEMNFGGFQGALITREDQGLAYAVMSQMNAYNKISLEEAGQRAQVVNLEEVSKVGSEIVNDYPSDKYKIKFSDQNGRGGGYVWVTHDGIPIKWDMIYQSRGRKGERMKIELVDLILTQQDAKWFELDPAWQPLNLGSLGGMAGMLGGQGTQGGTVPSSDVNVPSVAGQLPQEPPEDDEQTSQPGVVDTVEREAKSETNRQIGNKVREGIRGIFNRNR